MSRQNLIPLLVALAALTPLSGARARPGARYEFKDPKTLNAVMLLLDSPLEPMVAMATGVSGNLEFDPDNPGHASGKIVVDAGSVQFANPGLTATAQGPDGFDVQRFPTIEFVLRTVKRVRTVSPSVHAATVVGDFSCRGVTRTITVDATVTHLPGKAMVRHRSGSDLLVLRSTFKIHRRDFGIKPRRGDDLLAEDVEVRLSIAGSAP
jgi:polyisoprenoid-binding protein YceI